MNVCMGVCAYKANVLVYRRVLYLVVGIIQFQLGEWTQK